VQLRDVLLALLKILVRDQAWDVLQGGLGTEQQTAVLLRLGIALRLPAHVVADVGPAVALGLGN